MTIHCPQEDDYVVLFEDGRYEYACEVCVEVEKDRPHVVQVVELDDSEEEKMDNFPLGSLDFTSYRDGAMELNYTCPDCDERNYEFRWSDPFRCDNCGQVWELNLVRGYNAGDSA
mgnify:CR=1 FL=1